MMQKPKQFFKHQQYQSKYTLSKLIRILIYTILFISLITINFSNGLFPYSSISIKEDLHLNNSSFGLFALANNLGKIFGSFLFMYIINITNRKLLIILALLSKSLIIFLFANNKNNDIIILLIYKIYLGTVSMMIFNYVPLWIEQFSMQNIKIYLKSLIQIGNPLGKITAFIMNHYFCWKDIMFIESAILFLCGLVLIFIKHLYYSSKVVIFINAETNEEFIDKKEQKVINVFNLNDKQRYSFCMKISLVLKRKIYTISLLLKIFILGIQNTLQFWIPDYMITSLHIQNNSLMKLISNILIITSSPIGAFFCGIFISFSFTGYKQQNRNFTLIICFYIIACLGVFYIPYIENPELFVFVIIVFFFFSSACLHMLQGICMSVVDKEMKGIAFTISNCISFFIGSGIMPWIYGIQKEKYIEEGNYAMIFVTVIMVGCGLAVMPFFVFLCYFKIEEKNDEWVNENKRRKIEFVSWNLPNLSYSNLKDIEKRKSVRRQRSHVGIVVNEFANAFAEPSIIDNSNISQEYNIENMNTKLLSDEEE